MIEQSVIEEDVAPPKGRSLQQPLSRVQRTPESADQISNNDRNERQTLKSRIEGLILSYRCPTK